MSTQYCHHCGKKLPVAGSSFCCFCGTSLSSLTARPLPPAQENQFVPILVNEDDDDGERRIDSINHLARIKSLRMSALDVEIVKDRSQGETIGALAAQVAANGGVVLVDAARDVPPAIDSKQFLETFQKEAGASRPNEKRISVEIT